MGDLGEVLHIDEKAPNALAETFKVKAFSNQLVENSSAIGFRDTTPPLYGA